MGKMSSEEEEQNILPASLQKLEIVPPNIKITDCSQTVPDDLNPFYMQSCAGGSSRPSDAYEALFGPKCDCSNYVVSHRQSGNNTDLIEHAIRNPTQFKPRKNQQKPILKQPILKYLGKCLHNQQNTPAELNSKIQILINSNETFDNNSLKDLNEASVTSSLVDSIENKNSLGNWQHKDECSFDFKSLVTECASLTLTSSSHLHNTKSFRTLQKSMDVNRNQDILQENERSEEENYDEDNLNASSSMMMYQQQPSTSTNLNSSFGSNSSSIGSSNNNSTCSQQALINPTSCDITTDELASYFETIVHIPKKMSSMAEMMYI